MACVDEETMDPTLASLVNSPTLRWVFVGGKGGVGKTTVSCSLAIQFSKVRQNVLLISTDPAHNLSDAFDQRFTKSPTAVNGFTNLFAMEVDPTIEMGQFDVTDTGTGGFLAELSGAIPGIDEMMSFAQMMKLVNSMNFSTIVFDTAPTGHTLRLLALPEMLDKSLSKILAMKAKLGGLFTQISSAVGSDITEDEQFSKLQQTKQTIEQVSRLFKDPTATTFVCVCIPEFLSVFETERLIQELAKHAIDCQNVVVNQLVMPPPGEPCKVCQSRVRMQQKYLDQIGELYGDLYHVVKLPLLGEEIRGVARLKPFSELLVSGQTVTSVHELC